MPGLRDFLWKTHPVKTQALLPVKQMSESIRLWVVCVPCLCLHNSFIFMASCGYQEPHPALGGTCPRQITIDTLYSLTALFTKSVSFLSASKVQSHPLLLPFPGLQVLKLAGRLGTEVNSFMNSFIPRVQSKIVHWVEFLLSTWPTSPTSLLFP